MYSSSTSNSHNTASLCGSDNDLELDYVNSSEEPSELDDGERRSGTGWRRGLPAPGGPALGEPEPEISDQVLDALLAGAPMRSLEFAAHARVNDSLFERIAGWKATGCERASQEWVRWSGEQGMLPAAILSAYLEMHWRGQLDNGDISAQSRCQRDIQSSRNRWSSRKNGVGTAPRCKSWLRPLRTLSTNGTAKQSELAGPLTSRSRPACPGRYS